MTAVEKYFKKGKWNWETSCDEPFRVFTVQLSFIADGEEDETEFCIYAFNIKELSDLFSVFCKENGFKNVEVYKISVVLTAATMDELIQKECVA